MHKKSPHKNKQVLKDPMHLAKSGYERVDKVTYLVNRPLGQGMFPEWNPFLRYVEKMIWMGTILFGMGFMTYKGL
jgi:hypothetical protein